MQAVIQFALLALVGPTIAQDLNFRLVKDLPKEGSSFGRFFFGPGAARVDINGDGLDDLITLDILAASSLRPMLFVNLGTKNCEVAWSSPLYFADAADYNQIAVARLPSKDGGWGVLLSGAESAQLYSIDVTCNPECTLSSDKIWSVNSNFGFHSGTFVPPADSKDDPDILLTGKGGVSVFRPGDSGWDPDGVELFYACPQESRFFDGLAVGHLGENVFIGLSSPRMMDSNDVSSSELWSAWLLVRSYKGNYYPQQSNCPSIPSAYTFNAPSPDEDVVVKGLATGDLDGDGYDDMVAVHFHPTLRVDDWARVYFLTDSFSPIDDSFSPIETSRSIDLTDADDRQSGTSAAVGQIFSDSTLPDIALGTDDGFVHLYANLGRDEDGDHKGFEFRLRLRNSVGSDSVYGGPVRPIVIGKFSSRSQASIFYINSEGGLMLYGDQPGSLCDKECGDVLCKVDEVCLRSSEVCTACEQEDVIKCEQDRGEFDIETCQCSNVPTNTPTASPTASAKACKAQKDDCEAQNYFFNSTTCKCWRNTNPCDEGRCAPAPCQSFADLCYEDNDYCIFGFECLGLPGTRSPSPQPPTSSTGSPTSSAINRPTATPTTSAPIDSQTTAPTRGLEAGDACDVVGVCGLDLVCLDLLLDPGVQGICSHCDQEQFNNCQRDGEVFNFDECTCLPPPCNSNGSDCEPEPESESQSWLSWLQDLLLQIFSFFFPFL